MSAALDGSPRRRAVRRWLPLRALGRAWVRTTLVRAARALPDDVTVLIGVRNRSDYRIVNALRSIRNQDYPFGRVTALVVDYGSDASEAQRLREICRAHGAELERVDGVDLWSRSRCLNVGLRRVRTRYVMTSDADLVLSPEYVADAVSVVRADPLSIACSVALDLPEDTVEVMRAAAERGELPDLRALARRTGVRLDGALHPSIALTHTAFHRAIRGYDEFFEGWGREDDDLMRRFEALGLGRAPVPDRSFYLHQWHPKFEGIPSEDRARLSELNDARYFGTHSILRNDANWGRRPGSADVAP